VSETDRIERRKNRLAWVVFFLACAFVLAIAIYGLMLASLR
jgi:hypothetical protein